LRHWCDCMYLPDTKDASSSCFISVSRFAMCSDDEPPFGLRQAEEHGINIADGLARHRARTRATQSDVHERDCYSRCNTRMLKACSRDSHLPPPATRSKPSTPSPPSSGRDRSFVLNEAVDSTSLSTSTTCCDQGRIRQDNAGEHVSHEEVGKLVSSLINRPAKKARAKAKA